MQCYPWKIGGLEFCYPILSKFCYPILSKMRHILEQNRDSKSHGLRPPPFNTEVSCQLN